MIELRTAQEVYEHYKAVQTQMQQQRKPIWTPPVVQKVEEVKPPTPPHPPMPVELAVQLFGHPPMKIPSFSKITAVRNYVAKVYNISLNELISRRRHKRLSHARHIVMYIAKELTNASYPQIARHLGGMDHTTVMHGCNRVARQLRTDPDFAQEIAEMIEIIKQPEAEDV